VKKFCQFATFGLLFVTHFTDELLQSLIFRLLNRRVWAFPGLTIGILNMGLPGTNLRYAPIYFRWTGNIIIEFAI